MRLKRGTILSKDNILNFVHVSKRGCWLWKFTRDSAGYGKKQHNGKMESVHRITYKLFGGRIRKDMNVLHKCDTPACCNPEHLFQGTDKANSHDMMRKGRWHSGRFRDAAKSTFKKRTLSSKPFPAHRNTLKLWRAAGIGANEIRRRMKKRYRGIFK